MLKSNHKCSYFLFFFTRNYAKVSDTAGLSKKAKKLLAEGIAPKMKIEVESNVNVLVREVCGTNLFSEGGENVKLKADEDYPQWLWKIHIGKPLSIHEMNPNTKEYWNKVKFLAQEKERYLTSIQKFKTVQK